VYTNKAGLQFVASPNELCTAAQTGILTDGLAINVNWKKVIGDNGKYPRGYFSGVVTFDDFKELFDTARDALQWCAPYFDPACHPGKSWNADWHLSDLQTKALRDKSVSPESKKAAMTLLCVNQKLVEFETFVKKLAWSFRHPPPEKKLEDNKNFVSKWQDVWHSLDRAATMPSIVCPRYCAEKFHYHLRFSRRATNKQEAALTEDMVKSRCENEYWFAKIGRTHNIPKGHCYNQKDFVVPEKDVGSLWFQIDNPATRSDDWEDTTVANVCVIGADADYTYYRLHAISGGFYSYEGVQRKSGTYYGIFRAVDANLKKTEATDHSSELDYSAIEGERSDWSDYFKEKNAGEDNIVWDFPEEIDEDSDE